MRSLLALGLSLVLFSSAVQGQADRYELGRRLKAFESQWEKVTAADRARALQILPAATRQFLTLQNAAAARTLDEATWALTSAAAPDPAQRWLASLAVVPERRIMDAKQRTLTVKLRQVYAVPEPSELAGSLTWRLDAGKNPDEQRSGTARFAKLPSLITLNFTDARPLPEGDHRLTMVLRLGDATTTITATISVIRDLELRWKRLQAAEVGESATLETATLASHRERLTTLLSGEVPESDTPAARLFSEAEAVASSPDKRFFSASRDGDFWLTVPTAMGNKRTPCRLFVPSGLDLQKAVPIVVALHGVGGSENLFFEGYGAGCVIAEAKKRGWFVLAPRGGLGFFGGPPPIREILDRLAERYPIDRQKVFLVGHSMGAALVVELVQKEQGYFAAVAALGGGGRVRSVQSFRQVPTFIGVGSADFARSAAIKLHRELASTPDVSVKFREYPQIEHIVIVRAAVADVFSHYESQVSRKLSLHCSESK